MFPLNENKEQQDFLAKFESLIQQNASIVERFENAAQEIKGMRGDKVVKKVKKQDAIALAIEEFRQKDIQRTRKAVLKRAI